MNSTAPTAVWQREILRGIETWLAEANINVGIVADSGLPLGSPGAVQGDSRFGDIRISASPLPVGTYATGSPFHWTGTTLGGDLVFNSRNAFKIGNATPAVDVYSVALHESGHLLGLPHSDLAGSVMNEGYRDYTGLGASDVLAIQSLYGPRVDDAADLDAGPGGNQTNSKSTYLAGNLLSTQLLTSGELTTATDVDTYKFTVPVLSLPTAISVRLKAAGSSLLTAKITVTNSAGSVVGSATTTDPLANDLAVQFTSPLLGGNYFVKVEKSGTAFAVGSYKLAVDLGPLGGLNPLLNLIPSLLDGNSDNTLATALTLPTLNPSGQESRFDYFHRGSIESNTDIDDYKISAPATPGAPNLNVLVWARNGSALNPRIRVFNSTNQPVEFQVLGNQAGLMSVRIANTVPGDAYYVEVSSRDSSNTGDYALAADFNKLPAPAFQSVVDRTISSAAPFTTTTTVSEAGFFQFSLGSLGASSGSVQLTVRNATGNVILTLNATAGQPALTSSLFLTSGTYTLQLTTLGSTPLRARLDLLKLSDPVGTYKTKTSVTSDSAESSPEVSSESTPRNKLTGFEYIF